MVRQQFRLAFGQFGKAVFQEFCDLAVNLSPGAFQKRLISHILNQSMLENIARIGRMPALVKQFLFDQMVKIFAQRRLLV